jgi:type IV pilus assembly protein PilE
MHARFRKVSGFSLVELMIVVVIIGILTAVAIPGYSSYVMRTNRAAARSCMLEYGQFMERYYTTNLTYAGAAPGALGCASDANLNTRYTFTVGNLAQNTYTITATPIGPQLAKDTACATLTVNQAGTRTESGSSDVTTCWAR